METLNTIKNSFNNHSDDLKITKLTIDINMDGVIIELTHDRYGKLVRKINTISKRKDLFNDYFVNASETYLDNIEIKEIKDGYFIEDIKCELNHMTENFYRLMCEELYNPKITINDITHLVWLHDRIVNVYDESRHVDFLIKFREIIEKIR